MMLMHSHLVFIVIHENKCKMPEAINTDYQLNLVKRCSACSCR